MSTRGRCHGSRRRACLRTAATGFKLAAGSLLPTPESLPPARSWARLATRRCKSLVRPVAHVRLRCGLCGRAPRRPVTAVRLPADHAAFHVVCRGGVGCAGLLETTEAVITITEKYHFVPATMKVTTSTKVTFQVDPAADTAHEVVIASCGATSPMIKPGQSWTTTLSMLGVHRVTSPSFTFMSASIAVYPTPAPTAPTHPALPPLPRSKQATHAARGHDTGAGARPPQQPGATEGARGVTPTTASLNVPVVFVPQSSAVPLQAWELASVTSFNSFDDDTGTVDSDDFYVCRGSSELARVLRLEVRTCSLLLAAARCCSRRPHRSRCA